ncbi:hypothetical protein SCHPADRAFT_238849 [Schizopora paradoxa]|uniref:Uncharacterized protein n=1 Tax=Schizopora paradoxa TaxID=27342 RepID=A0A0H2RWL6_9AGAM|nr:hypothetical protein SCHPADRAFT_238849 [Schizopora paradoxa]
MMADFLAPLDAISSPHDKTASTTFYLLSTRPRIYFEIDQLATLTAKYLVWIEMLQRWIDTPAQLASLHTVYHPGHHKISSLTCANDNLEVGSGLKCYICFRWIIVDLISSFNNIKMNNARIFKREIQQQQNELRQSDSEHCTSQHSTSVSAILSSSEIERQKTYLSSFQI